MTDYEFKETERKVINGRTFVRIIDSTSEFIAESSDDSLTMLRDNAEHTTIEDVVRDLYADSVAPATIHPVTK